MTNTLRTRIDRILGSCARLENRRHHSALSRHPESQGTGVNRSPALMVVMAASSTTGFVKEHVLALRDHGYRCVIVASDGPELRGLAADSLEVVPLRIEREPHLIADVRSLWALSKVMRQERPAILNASTPKASLLALLAGYITSVPVRIYQVRGLRLETMRGTRRKIYELLERLCTWLATTVVYNSHSLEALAVNQRLIHGDRPHHVVGSGSSKGVSLELFGNVSAVEASDLRTRLGINGGEPVIGYIGRLTRDKGISDLVEAFDIASRSHADLRLLLLGTFEDGDPLPASLRSRIMSDSRIVWRDRVDNPAPYYPLLDAFILPTAREGLPNVALEAQASRIPVVGYSVTGVIDAVLPGETALLVEPGDRQALAAAICRYLEDRDLRSAHGTRGRLHMINHFRQEDVVQQWLRFYNHQLEQCGSKERSARAEVDYPDPNSAIRHVTVPRPTSPIEDA